MSDTPSVASQSKGFILLTVILTLVILATLSFMLTRQSAINAGGVTRENQPHAARYAAEAGYNHALWQLNQQNCTSYADIPTTSFGNHSYTVTITDAAGIPLTNGSPAKVSATGSLVDNISRSLIRKNVKIYQTPLSTLLQPGAASGKDSEIWAQRPNNNYGDGGETWVSSTSNDTTRSLLLFNMDTIPQGAKLITATLSLLRQSGSGSDQPVSAHRITNSWSEDVVTWNQRETGTNWNTAGTDFDNIVVATTPVGPVNQRYEWNITPLAQGWVDGIYPNYGVVLVAAIAGMSGERFYTSDDSKPTRHPRLTINYACECGQTCSTSPIDKILLSTRTAATLASLNFKSTDLAEYDPDSNAATLYFDGSTTSLSSEIDALHLLENNNIVLSTKDNATLGGLSFKDGDLVEYDLLTDIARLYFDENNFSNDENITSVFVMDNGHILLSTASNATIGSLSFTTNDLVEYDPAKDLATLYFAGAKASLTGEIDAVHILKDDRIIISTKLDDSIGSLKFKDGDLVNIDPANYTATLYFDEALFNSDEDVQSIHIGSASGPGLPPAKKIYWTDDLANKIQRSNEDGSAVEDVISGLDRPTGLDIDTINGKLYWTNNQQIQRANLDGSTIESLYSGWAVTFDIKLDVTGGKMYWTHDNGTSWVMRADLDGSNSETLNTSLNRPSYISLDIKNQHIYLTAFESGTVSRMNFDGSGVTSISTGPTGAIGSAIDLVNGKLFWSSGSSNDWIKRSNLDGTDMETIVTGLVAPQDIVYDADSDRIYWADYQIQRSQADGANRKNIVPSLIRPRGIVLVNADQVPAKSGFSETAKICNGIYRDNFETKSYDNNDGSLIWATDWIEINESDGADSGDIIIVFNGESQRLSIKRSTQGIMRGADLSGANSARLRFDYRTRSLDKASDYINVDVSIDGGKNWNEIHRFSGPADNTTYFPISLDISDYISPDFTLRFLSSDSTGRADYLYMDNIQIECSLAVLK